MGLRVLIIADPLERLNPAGDSSLALAENALARGHVVGFTTPDQLWRSDAVLCAGVQGLARIDPLTKVPEAEAAREAQVAGFDVVIMRKDPPIDAQYMLVLHLLVGVQDETLVVNAPEGLLRFSEKVMAPSLLAHMPPTLISQDRERLLAFVAQHGDAVLKPLYRNGGFGVVRLTGRDMTANSILDIYLKELREPVCVQAFLPAVFEGDKRVILMGTKIAGAFNRMPEADDFRSNMVVGGAAQPTTLTAKETAICEDVLAEMARQGVLFAGLDLIGEHLTEVNVTSPTGIRVLETLAGVDAAALFWDAVEDQLAEA